MVKKAEKVKEVCCRLDGRSAEETPLEKAGRLIKKSQRLQKWAIIFLVSSLVLQLLALILRLYNHSH